MKSVGLAFVSGLLGAACGKPDDPRRLFPGSPKREDLPDEVEIILTGVPTINENQLAENQVTFYAAQTVYIARDADGYYAMSAFCTHASCNIENSGGAGCGIQNPDDVTQGFQCCCHGSVYDALGEVTSGPAPLPLPHYRLVIDTEGVLWVDRGLVVAPDYRAVRLG